MDLRAGGVQLRGELRDGVEVLKGLNFIAPTESKFSVDQDQSVIMHFNSDWESRIRNEGINDELVD